VTPYELSQKQVTRR